MSTTAFVPHHGRREIPAWAYLVGGLVYIVTTFLAFPLLLNYLFPALSIPAIVLVIFFINYFGARTYFTFRSRILDYFGVARTHSHPRINELAEINIKVLAVGASAYRAAPLAEAWTGLTGRERVQPDGQRTLILALTLLAVNILETGTLAVIVFTGLGLVFLILATSDSTLSYILCAIIMLVSAIGQVAHWRICQSAVRTCQHLPEYFGYRWAEKHPVLRGISDQMLATYHLPNPTRDRELRDDAALEAQTVGV